MGKYGDYGDEVTGEFDEEAIDELLDKYIDTIDKYYPKYTPAQKALIAKHLALGNKESWVKTQEAVRIQRKMDALKASFKGSPGPGNLAKLLAYKAQITVLGVAPDILYFATDSLVGLITLTDPKEIAKDRERENAKKNTNEMLSAQKGAFRTVSGPFVKEMEGMGLFGSSMIIIKSGRDMAPTGMRTAKLNNKNVNCFIIGDTGIHVVKKLGGDEGSLAEWLNGHTDDYLVRIEGKTSDITGQDRAVTQLDKDYGFFKPLADVGTLAVEIVSFRGIYLNDDQYQVINTGLVPAKIMLQDTLKLGGGVATSVMHAPGELAETVRAGKELAETAFEALEFLRELTEKAQKDSGIASVTFSPTGGQATESATLHTVNCLTDTFDVDGEPGRGIRIGDIAQSVLSWAAADKVSI